MIGPAIPDFYAGEHVLIRRGDGAVEEAVVLGWDAGAMKVIVRSAWLGRRAVEWNRIIRLKKERRDGNQEQPRPV